MTARTCLSTTSVVHRTTTSVVLFAVMLALVACGGDHDGPDGAATATGAPPTASPATAPATSPATAPGPTTTPGVDGPQLGLPHGTVVFESKQGDITLDVEIAATEDQRRIGLMFRNSLEPGTGMIFLMPTQTRQIFWMKNTLIPLDMIYVDDNLRVVGVVAQAAPRTLSQRAVDAPSRYVVEVPGGFAAEVGIAAGDRMRARGIAGIQ